MYPINSEKTRTKALVDTSVQSILELESVIKLNTSQLGNNNDDEGMKNIEERMMRAFEIERRSYLSDLDTMQKQLNFKEMERFRYSFECFPAFDYGAFGKGGERDDPFLTALPDLGSLAANHHLDFFYFWQSDRHFSGHWNHILVLNSPHSGA